MLKPLVIIAYDGKSKPRLEARLAPKFEAGPKVRKHTLCTYLLYYGYKCNTTYVRREKMLEKQNRADHPDRARQFYSIDSDRNSA